MPAFPAVAHRRLESRHCARARQITLTGTVRSPLTAHFSLTTEFNLGIAQERSSSR
jgi:hypothetical protein